MWETLQGSSVKEQDAGTAHLTFNAKNWWSHGIKTLNETNTKTERLAEWFWGNKSQGFKVGIVSDCQHQICDKDVIHYWIIESVNSEPAGFYGVLSSYW